MDPRGLYGQAQINQVRLNAALMTDFCRMASRVDAQRGSGDFLYSKVRSMCNSYQFRAAELLIRDYESGEYDRRQKVEAERARQQAKEEAERARKRAQEEARAKKVLAAGGLRLADLSTEQLVELAPQFGAQDPEVRSNPQLGGLPIHADDRAKTMGEILMMTSDQRDTAFWNNVWRGMLPAFEEASGSSDQENTVRIQIDGEQLTIYEVMDKVPEGGIWSNSKQVEDKLEKAMAILLKSPTLTAGGFDFPASIYAQANAFLPTFHQSLWSQSALRQSVASRVPLYLWAATLQQAAVSAPEIHYLWIPGGWMNFEDIFYVFLVSLNDEELYRHNPTYAVQDQKHTPWADAVATRAAAVESMTAWSARTWMMGDLPELTHHRHPSGESFCMSANSIFGQLVKYPEGRNVMWRKEYLHYWILHGVTKPIPEFPLYQRYQEDDARLFYTLSRTEYLTLLLKLDPNHQILQHAIQVDAMAVPANGPLFNQDARLLEYVRSSCNSANDGSERPRVVPADLQKYYARDAPDIEEIELFLMCAHFKSICCCCCPWL